MGATVRELWLLGGVTAAGKTGLSIEWAEKNGAEIISCDSVSFYRGLNLGSAKPSIEEQKQIVHHGLDLADLSETYDVRQFHAYASRKVEEILNRGKKVLLVGGSGFFLDGFLRPISDGVEIEQQVRNEAEKLFETGGLSKILKKLNELNPDGLAGLDANNPLRVLRALERCMQTGLSLNDLKDEFAKMPLPYQTFQKKLVWLDRENDDLLARIEQRTQQMLEAGMIEETERAILQGIDNHVSLASSVGYREVIEFLKNGGEVENLSRSITRSTRQLVSKQRKWFRKRFPQQSHFIIKPNDHISSEDLPWVGGT